MTSEPMSSRCVSLTCDEQPRAVDHPGVGQSRASRLPGGTQPIPEPAHGLDEVARSSELRSKALDVHVHRSRLNVRSRFPYGFEEVPARLNASATLGERHEETILGRRKLHVLAVHCNTMRAAVDLKCPDAKDVSRLLRRLGDAPENCPDAQHELLRAERLGQVVIGAERESANTILLLFPRREHEHGDIARCIVGSQLLEHVVAGHAGEHQVEHDQNRVLLPRLCDRVRAAGRRRNAVPGLYEVERHEGRNIRLVVHDEQSFTTGGRERHADRPRRRCWIFATIISMAMVLCPPRGTITSA